MYLNNIFCQRILFSSLQVIVVTIFLIVEIPMALYLIVTGILRLGQWDLFGNFLRISVQFLNFAVLLSYPINFFIYCRMSRAFRDAFTKLLCPSYIGSRQQRLHSIATPLLGKPSATTANNDQFELNNTNVKSRNSHLDVQPLSSVILTSKTNELPVSSSSLTPRSSSDVNRHSAGLRVSFDDDETQSTHTKYTHL
jgi:hypothetical protein